jgi:ABC-type transporter Mla maintaining outer membrane lipid asymmetry ATPase subunit MlaF
MPADIALESVSLSYGAKKVIDNVSFTAGKGEIVVIGGGSGQGKSSFLELCAGLVAPHAGRVLWDGRDIALFTKEELLAARRGSLGYLFQVHALIANFTTFDNIALPLRAIPGIAEPDIKRRVIDVMERLGISPTGNRFPEALSSYECKAASLARALIADPDLLLLDEPLAGVDRLETERLLGYIEEHFRQRGIGILMVSHCTLPWPGVPLRRLTLKNGILSRIPNTNDNKENTAL